MGSLRKRRTTFALSPTGTQFEPAALGAVADGCLNQARSAVASPHERALLQPTARADARHRLAHATWSAPRLTPLILATMWRAHSHSASRSTGVVKRLSTSSMSPFARRRMTLAPLATALAGPDRYPLLGI